MNFRLKQSKVSGISATDYYRRQIKDIELKLKNKLFQQDSATSHIASNVECFAWKVQRSVKMTSTGAKTMCIDLNTRLDLKLSKSFTYNEPDHFPNAHTYLTIRKYSELLLSPLTPSRNSREVHVNSKGSLYWTWRTKCLSKHHILYSILAALSRRLRPLSAWSGANMTTSMWATCLCFLGLGSLGCELSVCLVKVSGDQSADSYLR